MNKRNDEAKEDVKKDEPEFSATVQARRERLAREVGDASDETDGKLYGVTDREKREDEK